MMMRSLIHTFIIIVVCAYLQCSKKKIIRKSYIKSEVFKCMIPKLVKYNLNKKLQIYVVGQPSASSSRNISFATGVFYQ